MNVTQTSQAPAINERIYRKLVTTRNNHPVTTSRKVADFFGKNHQHVLRDIKNLGCSEAFRLSNFGQSFYLNAQGKRQPEIEMSKNGLVILVMGYAGEKAMCFKELYIKRFDEMEAELLARQERAVLEAKDFVRLVSEDANFNALLKGVGVAEDEFGRKGYDYAIAMQRLGFSMKSGSFSRRIRKFPQCFFEHKGLMYVTEDKLYAMFLQRLATHNNKVANTPQLQLTFNQKGGVS